VESTDINESMKGSKKKNKFTSPICGNSELTKGIILCPSMGILIQIGKGHLKNKSKIQSMPIR
jgi:hypothetical protein